MLSTIKLPKLGDTADSVLIIEWGVTVGGRVAEGDVLLRVETDKVEADVPSPVGGVLRETLVEPGDEVPTGAPLARIEMV